MPCPRNTSRTDTTGRAYAGSQRQIQEWGNERTAELNAAISAALSGQVQPENITWVSPLASDRYSEYRDAEFVERLGLPHLKSELSDFWPRRGPCWDALATTPEGCILVEAKSHVPEVYGGGCGASEKTRAKIVAALDATKDRLGVDASVDWTGRLYQSANRYAYLYFLREIAGIPAFLLNVYFVDDPHSPTTEEQWKNGVLDMNRQLGVRGAVPFSASVFLRACS